MRSAILALVPIALGGCALMDGQTDGGRGTRQDWIAYGAEVARASAPEFEAMRTSARAAHAAGESADSAIRLAILEASPGNTAANPALAVQLLDEAAGSGDADAGDIEFIGFFRPLVVSRREQQAALDAARAETNSVRQQLNALRALEEQLDADD